MSLIKRNSNFVISTATNNESSDEFSSFLFDESISAQDVGIQCDLINVRKLDDIKHELNFMESNLVHTLLQVQKLQLEIGKPSVLSRPTVKFNGMKRKRPSKHNDLSSKKSKVAKKKEKLKNMQKEQVIDEDIFPNESSSGQWFNSTVGNHTNSGEYRPFSNDINTHCQPGLTKKIPLKILKVHLLTTPKKNTSKGNPTNILLSPSKESTVTVTKATHANKENTSENNAFRKIMEESFSPISKRTESMNMLGTTEKSINERQSSANKENTLETNAFRRNLQESLSPISKRIELVNMSGTTEKSINEPQKSDNVNTENKTSNKKHRKKTPEQTVQRKSTRISVPPKPYYKMDLPTYIIKKQTANLSKSLQVKRKKSVDNKLASKSMTSKRKLYSPSVWHQSQEYKEMVDENVK